MATDKAQNEHHEGHPEHESALTGALALANVFSNCVEAFGLIHPAHKWEKEEQLLLSRLGIQQARLLIWGDVVGVSSPPKTVTDRAVPKHPSAAYPDLTEPTFFGARDVRLDQPEFRTRVENALGAIVDRQAGSSRDEMMERYGLRPPKRFTALREPALDVQRLEGFRERYELLQEVGETFANLGTRRTNSIVASSWTIADNHRFANFIKLTTEKIDEMIKLMGVQENVDRGMRVDIKSLGWHLTSDKQRLASDTSKLRLLKEVCLADYPQYVGACDTALDNINRENREHGVVVPVPAFTPAVPSRSSHGLPKSSHAHTSGENDKHKRPGILGMFKAFGKSRDKVPSSKRRNSASVEPLRSLSDAGPTTYYPEIHNPADEDGGSLEPVRSKSVGDILDTPGVEEIHLQNRLQQMRTQDDEVLPKVPLVQTDTVGSVISRHDQYHGIGRVETKDQRQGW
ncbi:hypothetical protein LTR62_000561 [Meristemomyces frigidus]|uniref:Prion-inhibition and propagation HeLo domain-containing protein n=1 Tax=Meristemomyces frigidus TaxID=1508187 RepID=A0AAN7YGT7_9PEZI|nr:hypothetical protein LTR62_000561 [Meristemomyces frigidus]